MMTQEQEDVMLLLLVIICVLVLGVVFYAVIQSDFETQVKSLTAKHEQFRYSVDRSLGFVVITSYAECLDCQDMVMSWVTKDGSRYYDPLNKYYIRLRHQELAFNAILGAVTGMSWCLWLVPKQTKQAAVSRLITESAPPLWS